MRSAKVLGLVVVAGGFVGGCTSYYEVTDPGTNRVYYTEKLDRRDSGTVRFKDARTGAEITLPASEITEMSKEKYDAAKSKPPTTAP
jgi:hypothetical protein